VRHSTTLLITGFASIIYRTLNGPLGPSDSSPTFETTTAFSYKGKIPVYDDSASRKQRIPTNPVYRSGNRGLWTTAGYCVHEHILNYKVDRVS